MSGAEIVFEVGEGEPGGGHSAGAPGSRSGGAGR